MNIVFESFCRAALMAKFQTPVGKQKFVGRLFQENLSIDQIADFIWSNNGRWIGDAKWKLLGQEAPNFDETGLRQNAISPHDVRQLTVYAELLKRKEKSNALPQLAILYPMLGTAARPTQFKTWNDTNLWLWPIQVRGWTNLRDTIQTC